MYMAPPPLRVTRDHYQSVHEDLWRRKRLSFGVGCVMTFLQFW